jgi:hypothetical protein
MSYGYGVMSIEGYYGHVGFESYVATNPDNNTTIIVGTNDAMVRSMDLFMGVAGISLQRKNSK